MALSLRRRLPNGTDEPAEEETGIDTAAVID
jgi:hypothetical protein